MTAGTAVETVLQFVFILLVGRELGPEQFGYYGYLIAIVTLAGTVVHFGLPVTGIRETVQRPESEPHIYAAMFRIRAALAVFFFAIAFFFYFFQPIDIEQKLAAWLIFFYLLTLPFELAPVFDAKRQWRWDVPGRLLGRFCSLILVIALWRRGNELSLFDVAVSTAVLYTVYILASWIIAIRNNLSLKPFAKTDEVPKLIKASAPLTWSNLMTVLYSQSQLIFVKWLTTPLETGYYALVLRLIVPLILFKGVIYRILIPLISDVARNPVTLQARLERIIPNLNLLFMPATTLAIILVDLLLVPIFGTEYSGSVLPAQIAMLDFLVSGAGSLIGTTVFAAGNARTFTIGLTLGTVVSIVCSALLVPKYGATGAALGYLIGSQVATFYPLRDFLNLCRPDVTDRTVRVAAPCAIALIAHFLLTKLGGVQATISSLAAIGLMLVGLSVTREISRQRLDAVISMFRPKPA